jgi:hypothetical protein
MLSVFGGLMLAGMAYGQVAAHYAISDAVVEVEDNIYYPGRDPEAYVAQNLVNALEESVWGISLDSEVWNLDLDFPVTDNNWATGQNRYGLPFEVTFGSLDTIRTEDGGVFGIWMGTVSAIGDFHLCGAYIENHGVATLVPLYSRVDQNKMARIVHNYSGRQWACVLDPLAQFQANQNNAMMTSCANTHKSASYAQLAVCTIGGAGACWWSMGIGCLVGGVCIVSTGVHDYFWRDAFEQESAMNRTCLCNDVAMRNAHPEIPTPTSPCSAFDCPSIPGLLIPGID